MEALGLGSSAKKCGFSTGLLGERNIEFLKAQSTPYNHNMYRWQMLMGPAIKITASPKCFGGSEETLASLWGSGGARYGARGRDVWEEWGFIGHHIALSPRIDHERVDRESTVKMGPSLSTQTPGHSQNHTLFRG